MTQLFLKTQTVGYYMDLNANQVLYSQLFSNAAWVKTNMTLTAGQTDPSAGTQAFRLTAAAANATLQQSVVLAETLNRTFSIYLKRVTGTGDISITVDGVTYSVKVTTASWTRFETTLMASGTVLAGIKIATLNDAVDAAWAQLEDGVMTAYKTNTANRYTVTQIVDADYPRNTARGCAFFNGRFFVMTPAGEIYQSLLEDVSSWSALEFIQSQVEPDRGVYLAKLGNYLVTLKGASTEFFYDAANPVGSILSPVQNAAFPIGCASADSVKEMAGTLVWMGHTREGFGRGIFMLEGQTPKKISTPAVEKLLNADSLATVYSWAANVGSHLLYGLTLVTTGVTLVYDFSTQWWSFFTMLGVSGAAKTITAITDQGVATSTSHGYNDGAIILVSATNSSFNGWHIVSGSTANTYQLQATGTAFSGTGSAQLHTEAYFPISSSIRCSGKQYMQHATSGVLYEFSQSAYTDAVGAIAARIRTPKLDQAVAKFKFMGQVEVIGDKIPTQAAVRWTDDDFVTYSGFRSVKLGENRSRLRRLGKYNRRAFEILHVGNALLRLEALEVDE